MCRCPPVLAQGRDTFRLFCNCQSLPKLVFGRRASSALPAPLNDKRWWNRLLTVNEGDFLPHHTQHAGQSMAILPCLFSPMRLHHGPHGMECLRCHSSPLGSQDWSSGHLSFIETNACEIENWDIEKVMNYFASSDRHHAIQFIPSDFLSVISSDILSGISSDILSGISSDILSGISSDILSGILYGILSGILYGILYGILFGILYGFVSGRWRPVKVRRGPGRAESRLLKSGEAQSAQTLGEAHSAQTLAGWSPARPKALRPSPVEARRGPQRSDPRRGPQRSDSRRLKSGEDHCYQELADEIRRGSLRSRAGRWGPARKDEEEGGRRRSRASDIKSNNPHLAGGGKWWTTSSMAKFSMSKA